MPDRRTIVGGSVASLAAALIAARAGHAVDLYLDPPRVGGSFAGIEAGGRRLDLGCRLFELDYEPAPPAPFDPASGTHRPLIAPIAAFIRGIMEDELRPAAEPEMWINKHRTRCVLMTVNTAALPAALAPKDRIRILQELRALPAAAAQDDTIKAASLSQHGARLHALLIEPLCVKQYGAWPDVLAAERRKLWMALFHRQTLIETFSGAPIKFRPHRPFTTTRSGVAHPFVHRLHQALIAQPGVAIHKAGPLTRIEFNRDGDATMHFAQRGISIRAPAETTAIGVPPAQLFAAASIPYAPERLKSSILWVDVPRRDIRRLPSSLMVCTPTFSPFRISAAGQSEAGDQTIAIEFGAAPPSLEAARTTLRRTGVIAAEAPVTPVHQITAASQTAPTAINRDRFNHAATSLRAQGMRAAILGSARRFGWDSLNDQIADAIHYGAARC